MAKLTVAQFASQIKASYPDYAGIDDYTLAHKIVDKYPKYKDVVDLSGPSLGKAEGIRGPLSTMERIKALGKQTLRAAPEMIGAVGGGILGGATAGPAGAIGGAGAGAMLGKTAEIGLRNQFPNAFGGAQSYEGLTPAQEIFRSGGYAAAGEGTGQVAGKIVPRMLQRNVRPETQKAIDLLRAHDVPISAGDYRAGGGAQQIENLLKGTLMGGSVVTKKDIASAEALEVWRQDLMKSLGSAFDDVSLGAATKASVEKRHAQLMGKKGLFENLYDKVQQLYPGKVDASKIRAWVTQEKNLIGRQISPGTGMPSLAGTKEAPSKYLSLLKDLEHFGQKKIDIPATATTPARKGWVDVPITYQDVWNIKQNVDSTIRNIGDDALSTRARSVIREIHNRLDEAMVASANATDPKAAAKIKKINAAYREAKQMLETGRNVSPLRVENKIDDEKVVGRFFRQNSITPVKELYRAIPVEDRPKIIGGLRRKAMENFFSGGVIAQPEAGVTALNSRLMMSKWNIYKDEFKEWLTDKQYKNFEQFMSGAYQAASSGRMINPSSGRQMLAYGQITSAIGSLYAAVSGNASGSAIMAAPVVLPYFISKAMMNNRISKLLAEGVRVGQGTREALEWTPRFMNAARSWWEAGMPDTETENADNNAAIQ